MEIRQTLVGFSRVLAALCPSASALDYPAINAIADPIFAPLCRGDEDAWRKRLRDLFGAASNIYRLFVEPKAQLAEITNLGYGATAASVRLLAAIVADQPSEFSEISTREYRDLLSDPCAYTTFLRLVEEAAFIAALRHGRNRAWDLLRQAVKGLPRKKSLLHRFSDEFVEHLSEKLTLADVSGDGMTEIYLKLTSGSYPNAITISDIIALIRKSEFQMRLAEFKRMGRYVTLEDVIENYSAEADETTDLEVRDRINTIFKAAFAALPDIHAEIAVRQFLMGQTAETIATEMGKFDKNGEPQTGSICWYFSEIRRLICRHILDHAPDLSKPLRRLLSKYVEKDSRK